jgi:hypothetical protein
VDQRYNVWSVLGSESVISGHSPVAGYTNISQHSLQTMPMIAVCENRFTVCAWVGQRSVYVVYEVYSEGSQLYIRAWSSSGIHQYITAFSANNAHDCCLWEQVYSVCISWTMFSLCSVWSVLGRESVISGHGPVAGYTNISLQNNAQDLLQGFFQTCWT